ncbi:hypothetical protein BRADI_2g48387v3 [Brachypodium distachyon]|uniref:PHD-type domain-containing protein n=1 Tax=Brachypodium distachyon TaxID=15368 RepID=A0A0Q3MZ37_BRADI|nr:hypothetical protein BRADI_2g48387v3 [Brachypodium distachyon]
MYISNFLFCYTCIDNWAAITNRCPLCKCEFQHITSTPVYDDTGASTEDEYPLTSGDDDWYSQGENSTLSFPSFYIDAEAVVCLDGGDCMIRSGIVAPEDDLTLDTSIACDSCDLWYHAICVGFNPEMTSEDSWLCPRCVSTEVKNKSDVILKQNFSGDCVTDSDRTTADASFSERVSVSVADDGETAIVVSMVGVNSRFSEGSLGSETGQAYSNSYPSYSKDDSSHDAVANAHILRDKDNSCGSPNKSSGINLVHMVSSEPTQRSSELSPIRESATTLFSSEHGNISNEQLEEPQDVSSYFLLHRSKEAGNTGEENAVPRNNNETFPAIKSPQLFSAASKTAISSDINMTNTDAVQQMKSDDDTQLPPMQGEHNTNDMESGNETGHPAKKAKLGVPDHEMHLITNSGVSSTDCHTTIAAKVVVSDTAKIVEQNKHVPDIMSIVEGEGYMRDPGRELAKPVGRRSGDKPGLRMKKIFHKEGKQSSVVVQKLQQEIRDVVRDNGVSILEKDNAFDEKLLTAFRAAIGKSMDGPAKRTNLSLSTRKSLLQKGKIRENLTKKLYGTSTGRRRSAWHRDWEVDFWKHRCSPGINPEKIETLQSVLQLLKKSSDTGMRKESAEEKKAFLSRLYLADASVVPRKDDIKPLSALKGFPLVDKNSQIKAKDSKSTSIPAPGTETSKTNSPNSISSSSSLNKEASSRRENINGQPPLNQQNQSDGDIKHDKRKWALEVLARKNASSLASKDKNEGTDDLNGNYPLLAKLPVDMRPQLTTDRHNKVPMSVRQAQLYRIAEHYLQKANLDVIRRCADTELAIADAVNVEKDIYGKSSSKSVYVNLCSQATRQPAKAKSENNASTLGEKTELGSDLIMQQVRTENTNTSSSDVEEAISSACLLDLPVTTRKTEKGELGGVPEQNANEHVVSFNSVEEALKRAGLFDSPPNSPERKTTTTEYNPSTVSSFPKISQQKCASVKDTSLVNAGEHCHSLPSTSDSRMRDASTLKDDVDLSVQVDLADANSQILYTGMSCEQPKCNSEEDQKLVHNNKTTDSTENKTFSVNLTEDDRYSVQCKNTGGADKEIVVDTPDEVTWHVGDTKEMDIAASVVHNQSCHGNTLLKEGEVTSKPKKMESTREKSSSDNHGLSSKHSKGDSLSPHPAARADNLKKDPGNNNTSDSSSSVYKKVEVFVKENIRPLCKSGVITTEQYRWAVAKTAEKVMKHHSEAKNANFLIKEGDKVKRLALQYVEAAQQKIN